MNKAELVTAVATASGVSKADTQKVLDALGQTVTEAVVANDTVMLPGLCKFAARETAERQVRNPATGEAMTKPAGRAVKVTVVKGLKDALKG